MLNALQAKIKDYHSRLVKQVELKATNLKANEITRVDYIEKKRLEFVLQIEHCELMNLKHLSETNINQFLAVLNDENLVYERLFKEFCFVIDKADFEFTNFDRIDATFGYLVITDKFLPRTELTIFKELFRYYHREKSGPWSKLLVFASFVNLKFCHF
jgi:hypothetical protein